MIAAPTPQELQTAQFNATQTYYWEKKDLPTYLATANSLLKTAFSMAEAGGELEDQYRELAVRNSYNMASMTWPGWDEEGIIIDDDQLALGLEAARLNVELARQMALPPERVQAGLWILAVQMIANNQLVEAEQTFEAQIDVLRRHELPGEQVSRGYLALIGQLNGDADTDVGGIIADLLEGDKEAAQQGEFLATAQKVFCG